MTTARLLAVGLSLTLAACAASAEPTAQAPATADALTPPTVAPEAPAARLLFVGDLMLGRRVATIVKSDRYGVFADIERVVGAADLAFANLESPLTTRAHTSDNPYALEADPASVELVAQAGFDLLGVANNHAGDAGSQSVIDTLEAVDEAGMTAVGGGHDIEEAWTPQFVDATGWRVAVLAFDISQHGLAADDGPGIASWDPVHAEAAVQRAHAGADIVVAGIHGGIEFWPDVDPQLGPVAEQLVEWGVDIVWGHGPHVAQPVSVSAAPDGRPAVVATSLGNFLFDQQSEETSHGSILEVMVDGSGVIGWRVGHKHHDDLRVHFNGWDLPVGDAALVDGDWWNLTEGGSARVLGTTVDGFPHGDVFAASTGDIIADSTDEILVSYRHPLREVDWDPRPLPVDEYGRSAHLGLFAPDWTPVWMSRRPPHPIGVLTACGGSAAFGYTTLDDPAVVATGAGVWNGFGFTFAADLAGPGTPSCADVDYDGTLDPIVVDRLPAS